MPDHAALQYAVRDMTSQVIKSQPFFRERCPGQGVLFKGLTNLRSLDLLSHVSHFFFTAVTLSY